MKLNFAVVGAQKAGTTALRQMLASHPGLTVADHELHIFDEGSSLSERVHPPIAGLLGDVTPIYMYWRDCPERMKAHNPRMKIIAVLRDPMERAWSHWRMEHARGKDPLSFGEALRKEDERLGGSQHRIYSYADRGRYGWQIERLLRLFGKNLLVLKYEDYRADHQAALDRVFRHLRVRRASIERRLARVSPPAEMAPQDRAYLAQKLEPEARRVETLLGWNCRDWCTEAGRSAPADST